MPFLTNQPQNTIPLFQTMITGACIQHRDGPYYFGNHIHAHFELYLIRSGACSMNIHQENHHFKENDLILILPYVVHSLTVYDTKCTFYHLHFKSDLFSHFMISNTSCKSASLVEALNFFCSYFYTQKASQNMQEEVDLIIKLAQENKDFSMALANLHIAQMLMHFLYKKSFMSSKKECTTFKNEYVNFTLKYIQEHYNQKILVSDIAKKLHISSRYLSKVFHQNMNVTLSHYINIYRMNQAIQLMSTTNLSLLEIALSVGLKDAQHFSRLFTQFMNMSPGKYRRSFLKEK